MKTYAFFFISMDHVIGSVSSEKLANMHFNGDENVKLVVCKAKSQENAYKRLVKEAKRKGFDYYDHLSHLVEDYKGLVSCNRLTMMKEKLKDLFVGLDDQTMWNVLSRFGGGQLERDNHGQLLIYTNTKG